MGLSPGQKFLFTDFLIAYIIECYIVSVSDRKFGIYGFCVLPLQAKTQSLCTEKFQHLLSPFALWQGLPVRRRIRFLSV